MAQASGIFIKKKFGQHFLRDARVTHSMINAVDITKNTSVLEIGCGDGFLTKEILQRPVARLWAFEIDPEWARFAQKTITDPRVAIIEKNFLDIDFSIFKEHQPWTVLSNLPYQVTFPILHKLQQHRDLFAEGVVMVQEEVAQKIVKRSGRGYGFVSLFFQYYFQWHLLDKIPPSAFLPPPKVFSRLLYFKPRYDTVPIKDEQAFWRFIKICFAQPRRTLRNNLASTHYTIDKLDERILSLRAQQLTMEDLVHVWDLLNV